MPYVDGFLLAVPKKKLRSYRRLSLRAGKLWRRHGALEYRECAGEDLKVKCGVPFPKLLRLKAGETVVFSWIVYRSRAHRDHVNAAVMKDPQLEKLCDPNDMPFDVTRMCSGGFKVFVEA